MNVLIIGSGGREHAIALKISESKNISKIYCVPGNPGTKKIAVNLDLNIYDHQLISEFCDKQNIDLVVIGPEQPLVEGLSDTLRKNRIKVFGPSKNAAQIESSKSFAKEIMRNANVATAGYSEFYSGEIDKAKSYIKKLGYPIVIKADGLAAGKGVIICNNQDQSDKALSEIFNEKIFGDSGNKIIIEEFMNGEEASVFAITDGKNFVCLPAAQDHKRIGDGDKGKNTGGMGAYAPTPIVTDKLMRKIESQIIMPVLEQMRESGNEFIGCLYAGLMIENDIPKVVEFNCRFGDPETQVVLPVLGGDFLELIYSAASGEINKQSVKYFGGCSVCVVTSSKGYPDKYEKGFEISGLEKSDNEIVVYHAGTKEVENKIVTNGGRVLGVTSVLKNFDLRLAQKKVYDFISNIKFEGMYFRKDIAEKAFKYLE